MINIYDLILCMLSRVERGRVTITCVGHFKNIFFSFARLKSFDLCLLAIKAFLVDWLELTAENDDTHNNFLPSLHRSHISQSQLRNYLTAKKYQS